MISGEKLKELREKAGLSRNKLAQRVGVSRNAVYNWESGGNQPKKAVVELLLSVLECSREELNTPPNDTIKIPPTQSSRKPSSLKESLSPNESRGEYDDYVFIPQMTGKISAGGGLTPDDRVEVKVAFRKDWLNRKGDPTKMSLVKVSGDSMEPTLLPGDLVLINHDQNYLDPQGGIYAVVVNNEIMIKRIHVAFPDGKVRIISDNRGKYEPVEVEIDKVHINGKVIWYGREIER